MLGATRCGGAAWRRLRDLEVLAVAAGRLNGATRRLCCRARLMWAAYKRDTTVLDVHRRRSTRNGRLKSCQFRFCQGVVFLLILLPHLIQLVDPPLPKVASIVDKANGLALIALVFGLILAGVKEVHQAVEFAFEIEDLGLVLLALAGDEFLGVLEGLAAGFRYHFFARAVLALHDIRLNIPDHGGDDYWDWSAVVTVIIGVVRHLLMLRGFDVKKRLVLATERFLLLLLVCEKIFCFKLRVCGLMS